MEAKTITALARTDLARVVSRRARFPPPHPSVHASSSGRKRIGGKAFSIGWCPVLLRSPRRRHGTGSGHLSSRDSPGVSRQDRIACRITPARARRRRLYAGTGGARVFSRGHPLFERAHHDQMEMDAGGAVARSKVFIINEKFGLDFLWLDRGRTGGNLAEFSRVRMWPQRVRPGGSPCGAFSAGCFPFSLAYLLLFAAIVHTKRRIRTS